MKRGVSGVPLLSAAADEFRQPRSCLSRPLDSAGKRKSRSPVSVAGIGREESRESPRPAGSSVLIAVGSFCHADPAACQNSREFPQIASYFRHVSLLGPR